jgi:ribonuclease Z
LKLAKLSVTFLGTSSATPTRSRNLPSILVERDGDGMLLDCGEGVQKELFKYRGGLGRLSTILVSHLHGDHVTGLIGLFQSMSMTQRGTPINLVGPPALQKWLKATFRMLRVGLTFDIKFIPAHPGIVLRTPHYSVRAAPADHSVEALCYVLEEPRRPGIFHPEKARALGIPEGKLWARLQRGRAVRIGEKTYRPAEVLGTSRYGRKIGYSGDTRPSESLTRFFRGCDLLVFDSTFHSRDAAKALERKHSTSREAAALAKRAKVRQLVLTHFSARYRTATPLLKDAREVFPNTRAAYDGMKLEIPYPASG